MTQRGNQQHHPGSIKSPSTRPRSALSVRLVPSLHLRLPCCLRVIYGCPAPSVSFIVIEPGPYCRPVPISTSLPVCPQCAPLLRLRLPSTGPVLQPALLLPLHLRLPCTAAFASAPIDSWPDCIPRSSPNTSLSPTSSPIFDTVYTRVTSSRDNIYKMPNHRPSTIPFRTNPIADTTTRRNPIKPAITYAKAWPMQSSSDFGEFPLS